MRARINPHRELISSDRHARRLMAEKDTTNEAERARSLRRLRQLIAALDRRVPHIERAGEIAIAHDAAMLRKEAVARIAQLEAASGGQSR